MRLLHRSTTRIMDGYRCSCPIDEQLLAGLVLLPQHHILFPPPPLVQLAEAAVLVAVRVFLPVLLPKQLLRQVCMLLPLTMKVGEVGHGQHRWAAAWRPAEQRNLKPVIIPLRSQRARLSWQPWLVAGTHGRCRGQSNNCGRSAATPGPLQT